MAFTIGSLDEKQTRFVLIASGLAAVAIAAIIIWRNVTSSSAASSSATTSSSDTSSSAPSATLAGVTEVWQAPGNLSDTSGTPSTTNVPVDLPVTPVTPPTPIPAPTPAPPVRTPAPPPTRTPAPTPTPKRTFVVKPWPQPGSSLSSIAQLEYGQSTTAHIDAIAQANHIANPNLIYPGQVLTIP